MWVRVLMDKNNRAWKKWNQFRTLSEHNPRIHVGKENNEKESLH